jgi:hypothetical protein
MRYLTLVTAAILALGYVGQRCFDNTHMQVYERWHCRARRPLRARPGCSDRRLRYGPSNPSSWMMSITMLSAGPPQCASV